MIKFRAQRLEDGVLIEGFYMTVKWQGEEIHYIDNGHGQPINPDTLQVLTTDGWADITDVEVRKKKQLPLEDMKKRLDEALEKETTESFNEWRNRMYWIESGHNEQK